MNASGHLLSCYIAKERHWYYGPSNGRTFLAKKNSNLKIKSKPLFRPHLQWGDFPDHSRLYRNTTSLFYFYILFIHSVVPHRHSFTRLLHGFLVSTLVPLQSNIYSATKRYFKVEARACHSFAQWLPINGFLSTLESNPRPLPRWAGSCQIWSKFFIYHFLPSSLYSFTGTFVLSCQCLEVHTCLGTFAQNALPCSICVARSVSASCFLLKYPLTREAFIISGNHGTSLFPLTHFIIFFVTLSQLYLRVLCLSSIPIRLQALAARTLFHWFLHPQHLEECLWHSTCSTNACWRKECRHELPCQSELHYTQISRNCSLRTGDMFCSALHHSILLNVWHLVGT